MTKIEQIKSKWQQFKEDEPWGKGTPSAENLIQRLNTYKGIAAEAIREAERLQQLIKE